MSYLTFNGQIVKSNGHFVTKIIPPPPVESTILMTYLNSNVAGLLKSIDSGVNFTLDASIDSPISKYFQCITADPSNSTLLLGYSDGTIYRYTNGILDAGTAVSAFGITDIQVRGNIRVAGCNGGSIVPF